jgi:hypothetical protein
MAWPLRIQWKGGWYHITLRENERQLIFRDVEDRREFPGRLSRDRGSDSGGPTLVATPLRQGGLVARAFPCVWQDR